MKTKTQRALDAALDKRQKRITDILVKNSILSYKKGDQAAHEKLNIESSFKQVHKAALVYVKEYGTLLTKEGASMIQDATPPYGYTKIAWLKDNSTRTQKQVVDVLEAGLKEGKPVASIGGKHAVEGTIAHDLQNLIVHGKEYENVRTARTEIARIQMEASKRRYTVNGIAEIDRLCGPDPCDACAALCGKRFKIDVAPGLLHPGCVCDNAPVIPKEGLKELPEVVKPPEIKTTKMDQLFISSTSTKAQKQQLLKFDAAQGNFLTKAEKKAANEYKSTHYYNLTNKGLRGTKGAQPLEMEDIERIKALDSAIQKTELPNDMIVYRGVSGNTAKIITKQGTCTDTAFTSTSYNPETATWFTDKGKDSVKHIMTFKQKKGTKALMWDKEEEIICARGLKLRCTGITEIKSLDSAAGYHITDNVKLYTMEVL